MRIPIVSPNFRAKKLFLKLNTLHTSWRRKGFCILLEKPMSPLATIIQELSQNLGVYKDVAP